MRSKASGPISDGVKLAYIQARIDEATFSKGKILTAVYGESFNSLMVRAMRNEIRAYETEHGPTSH